VNKVSTKVDMRLNIDKANWIPEEIRAHIKKVEKNKLNSEGFIVVSSQLTRMQSQNMEDALAKLQAIIDSAVGDLTVKEADEETIKRVKANIKAGQERRIQDKKKDGMKKKERSRRDFD
jgi:peptidyl-tRNA hydrolase ICT1